MRETDSGTPDDPHTFHDGGSVALRNAELLRWCFDHGPRVVYLLNMMALGYYQEPRASFLASIGYQRALSTRAETADQGYWHTMDNTHWWIPWLPLLGSILVTATAFLGVMINNKNSRAALRSARILDHQKWLRETLLQLGSHAAGHAFEIDRLYNVRSFATNDEVFTQNMLTLAGEIRRLSATADSLSLIGFPELAASCAEIRHAADRVVEPANTHRETIRSSAPEQHVHQTRLAVDNQLAALSEARKRFVDHAQQTLKDHALLQVDGI